MFKEIKIIQPQSRDLRDLFKLLIKVKRIKKQTRKIQKFKIKKQFQRMRQELNLYRDHMKSRTATRLKDNQEWFWQSLSRKSKEKRSKNYNMRRNSWSNLSIKYKLCRMEAKTTITLLRRAIKAIKRRKLNKNKILKLALVDSM